MATAMAGAAPSTLLPPKGATVDILGHKVSFDALLIAGAGLLGVFFLYKVGQPTGNASANPLSTVDPGGGGTPTATVPADPPQVYNNTYNIYGSGPAGTAPPSGGGTTAPPGSTTDPNAGFSNLGSPTQATYTPPSGGPVVTSGSPSDTAGTAATSSNAASAAPIGSVPGPPAGPGTSAPPATAPSSGAGGGQDLQP
jgi:hypothetical protein